jgi:hypothetical protein
MRDYRKWKRGTPNVASLLLDSLNPRIPRGRGIQDQRDLIAELVEHDNVYDLAKGIATDGYFPLEYLIAIETDSKAVVIEGNRRLAALKLLINPDLAPEAKLKSFKNLSNKIALDTIEKVPTIYAPSRESAAPLIMQKHTRRQVEGWSILMQASFYRSLADSGQSLSELAEEYGRPPAEIAGFLRTDTMYAIACSLDYPENIAAVVRDPRQFNASALQRILEVPRARDFLGIEFKDSVKLQGKVADNEFKKAYARIITDIASGDIDTRAINTVADIEKYLSKISTVKPKKSTTAKFSVDNFEISVPDLVKGTPTKPSARKSTKPRRASTMIPPGIRCELADQRINDIFGELRKLKPDTCPNACAVLLRVLLELSVADYLETTKQIQPLLDAAKRKGKGTTWYPTLSQLLDATLKDPAIISNMRAPARKRVAQLTQRNNTLLSLDDLDGYVHNNYIHPTSRDLFSLWSALEGLFEIVLKAPSKP